MKKYFFHIRFPVFLFRSDSLSFAAEPVVASLANLLGNHERLPSSVPAEIKVILCTSSVLYSRARLVLG